MKLIAICGSALLVLLATIASAAGTLEAQDAWVREAPPTATVLGAYLQLHNHTDRTLTLVHASSPDFKSVEIHRSSMSNGVARMTPVPRLVLKAQGVLSFEPGGLHLMLIEPHRELHAGDKVSITLHFTDHSEFEFSAPVQKSSGPGDNMSPEMNHSPDKQHP